TPAPAADALVAPANRLPMARAITKSGHTRREKPAGPGLFSVFLVYMSNPFLSCSTVVNPHQITYSEFKILLSLRNKKSHFCSLLGPRSHFLPQTHKKTGSVTTLPVSPLAP